MTSTLFSFALIAFSIYFFYLGKSLLGSFLILWAIARIFSYKLYHLKNGFSYFIKYSELEKNCNFRLECEINVEELVKAGLTQELFDKISNCSSAIEKGTAKDDLVNKLIKNYKEKYKKEKAIEKVRFQVKNNILWKNGDFNFLDTIYHYFFIPYKYDPNENDDDRFHTITKGISIRLLLTNGFLKLQIGEFSKALSPLVVDKSEYFSIYLKYLTITTFPLLYFSYQIKIPEKYLNASAYTTESWFTYVKDKKKEMAEDWKEVSKDIENYKYLCETSDDPSENFNTWKKNSDLFEKKKKESLKKENFNCIWDPSEDKSDYVTALYPHNSISYTNKYLTVNLDNFNDSDYLDNIQKDLFSDFREESPI